MMTVVLVLFTSLSMVAQEQDNQERRGPRFSREQMVEMRTNDMATQYGLDDQQKQKLLELNKQYPEAMPFMRPGGMRGGQRGQGMRGPRGNGQDRVQGAPREGAPRGEAGQGQRPRPSMGQRPRMADKETLEKYDQQLQQIMTQEQYTKFQADRKAQMERMQQWGGGRGQQRAPQQ